MMIKVAELKCFLQINQESVGFIVYDMVFDPAPGRSEVRVSRRLAEKRLENLFEFEMGKVNGCCNGRTCGISQERAVKVGGKT